MERADAIAGVLGILSLLALVWGISGLLKPKFVLWWAVPEKQTRTRAFAFGFFVGLTFLCIAFLWHPDSSMWMLVPAILLAFSVLVMQGSFRMTKAEIQEQEKARIRQKKAAITRTVYSLASDKTYEIHPFLTVCSCPDWEKKRYDADGPFAVCKHLAGHYAHHQDDVPDDLKPYQKLIAYFGWEDKGIPYQGEVYEYGVIDDMAYLFTGYTDRLPWMNVYTDIGGTERYGVNYETGRWASGIDPSYADILLERVRSLAP